MVKGVRMEDKEHPFCATDNKPLAKCERHKHFLGEWEELASYVIAAINTETEDECREILSDALTYIEAFKSESGPQGDHIMGCLK